MTINTTTVEASLQTALNATTGTTEAKELLLLGKAAEAITTVGSSLTSILTTQGDVVYRNATGPVRLAAGAAGEVLVSGGAGANLTWGTAAGANNFELASNMTARQVAQIDSTGKIAPITSSAPIAASLMATTPYPNTGPSGATGINYSCAVDPSNTNRFAVVAGDSVPKINVGLVAANGSVTWGATVSAGTNTGTTGHHDIEWDPVNDGVLWVRSGASPTGISRFSTTTGGVTLTLLGTFTDSSGYNYGTLDLHPTISGRFIITHRVSKTLRVCDLTSNTAYSQAATYTLPSKDANSHIAKFFPDDGTKILLLYAGSGGGSKARVMDLTGNTLTAGTEVVLGDAATPYFRAKSFTWEPNGDSSTGYRFALMVNGLTGASAHAQPDIVVGTVTNVGATGTITVGTAVDWGEAVIGGNQNGALSTSEFTHNMVFSPYNKTDLVVGTDFVGKCTLVGNELTLPTTTVSKTISGNSVSAANGSYNMLINLGSSGKYLSLMETSGGAIVNQHHKPAISNIDANKMMGLVTAAGSTGDTRTVQYSGQIGGFSGLTIGARHYVQADASVTSTQVSDSVFVGVAVNATTLQVKL
jgi:hypothetical protein